MIETKLNGQTPDIAEENITKLKAIFPDVFTEGKVDFEGKNCFIYGRRSSGYFDIRMLDGTVVHRSASYKNLKLIEASKMLLTERRLQVG